mmetsp:Transcript_16742/g.29299  ORF Transcript_16742/g.29299 Transcript_16742/m.29299 type:complete len:101 (-) Transcript_16742:42-344(-)
MLIMSEIICRTDRTVQVECCSQGLHHLLHPGEQARKVDSNIRRVSAPKKVRLLFMEKQRASSRKTTSPHKLWTASNGENLCQSQRRANFERVSKLLMLRN